MVLRGPGLPDFLTWLPPSQGKTSGHSNRVMRGIQKRNNSGGGSCIDGAEDMTKRIANINPVRSAGSMSSSQLYRRPMVRMIVKEIVGCWLGNLMRLYDCVLNFTVADYLIIQINRASDFNIVIYYRSCFGWSIYARQSANAVMAIMDLEKENIITNRS